MNKYIKNILPTLLLLTLFVVLIVKMYSYKESYGSMNYSSDFFEKENRRLYNMLGPHAVAPHHLNHHKYTQSNLYFNGVKSTHIHPNLNEDDTQFETHNL